LINVYYSLLMRCGIVWYAVICCNGTLHFLPCLCLELLKSYKASKLTMLKKSVQNATFSL